MILRKHMEIQENLYDMLMDLQKRIEEVEDRCLGYKYDIQELEITNRELQSQIRALDDRIDILKGEP